MQDVEAACGGHFGAVTVPSGNAETRHFNMTKCLAVTCSDHDSSSSTAMQQSVSDCYWRPR
jgi:hypothetical protein